MIQITSKSLGLTAFIAIAAILVKSIGAQTCAECKNSYDRQREKNCRIAKTYVSCMDSKTCTNETAKEQAYQEADQICATECNRCASTYNYAKPQDCKAAETYVSCTNQTCKEARHKDAAMNAKQTHCQQTQQPKGDSQQPKETSPPPKNDGQSMPPKDGKDPSMGYSSPPPVEHLKDPTSLPKGENPSSENNNQQKSPTTPGDMSSGTTDKCGMCKQTYSASKRDCASATVYSDCAKGNCVGDRSGDATNAADIKKEACDCEACKNTYDNSQKLCDDAKTYSACACTENEKKTAMTQRDSTCSSECTACKDTYEKSDKTCQSADTYVSCSLQNCPKDKTDMAMREKDRLCKDHSGSKPTTTTMKSNGGQKPAVEANKQPSTTMKNDGGKQEQNGGKEGQQNQNGDGSNPPTTTMNSKVTQKAEPVTAKQTDQKEESCPSLDTCVRTFILSINNGFVYTNGVCSGMRTAMKCFHGLTSGGCPSYKPYSDISYTFTDLLSLFTHYCTDTERAQTSCGKFETCFSTIKTPEDINSYTDAGYWCAVMDSTMKCGTESMNETGCEQLKPTTTGLAKIQDYCPNAFDVRTGKYIYNDGNIVKSSVLVFVLTLLAVIKNWM